MPTSYLVGNCDPCPACELRREAEDKGAVLRPDVPCNVCRGTGILPLPEAKIARRMVAETRRLLWPEIYARFGGAPLPKGFTR